MELSEGIDYEASDILRSEALCITLSSFSYTHWRMLIYLGNVWFFFLTFFQCFYFLNIYYNT